MRIMYVCRLFSGFESSLASKKWEPTGAPTIYKMFDKLDESKHELKIVMTGHGVGHDLKMEWNSKRSCIIKLKGINSPVIILPGEKRIPKILGRVRSKLNSLLQLIALLKIGFRDKPDLIYVHKSNYLYGAVASRFFNKNVIVRVMGVPPSMWDIFANNRPTSVLQRWAYKSPFKMVLCTQDGTSNIPWMEKALKKNVPRLSMLNGYSEQSDEVVSANYISNIPNDKKIILFIGRMEQTKGCHTFIDVINSLTKECKDKIHVVMIGAGSEREAVLDNIKKYNLSEYFTSIKEVPHKEIRKIHESCDIFLSLNLYGQISNTNIEALCYGGCIIVPNIGLENIYDKELNDMFNNDLIIKIDSEKLITSAKEKIEYLLNNNSEIESRKNKIPEQSRNIFGLWDDRIQKELNIIESLSL